MRPNLTQKGVKNTDVQILAVKWMERYYGTLKTQQRKHVNTTSLVLYKQLEGRSLHSLALSNSRQTKKPNARSADCEWAVYLLKLR